MSDLRRPGSGYGAPRLGPKADEGEDVRLPAKPGRAGRPGLSLRAVLPNAITAAALCAGLTGIRFAVVGDWRMAMLCVVLAGVLDAMDGRIARLLNAQSRFGAELDSLADSASFGMAPAIILYLWVLQDLPRFGWLAALAYAICCALRLARFNAQIDADEQPHKSAGYLTGIPAPVGAGLVFLPVFLWLATGNDAFRQPLLAAIWAALIAFLMISSIATLSWGKMRPKPSVRLALIAFVALIFAALIIEPWWTLTTICVGYLALMPWGVIGYGRVKRRRAAAAS